MAVIKLRPTYGIKVAIETSAFLRPARPTFAVGPKRICSKLV
jgi:hypothetical protein